MKFTDSSGRFFTDYTPNCVMNEDLQQKYAPNSTQYDFKSYLQHNADKIMKDMEGKYSDFTSPSKICPVCSDTVKSN